MLDPATRGRFVPDIRVLNRRREWSFCGEHHVQNLEYQNASREIVFQFAHECVLTARDRAVVAVPVLLAMSRQSPMQHAGLAWVLMQTAVLRP